MVDSNGTKGLLARSMKQLMCEKNFAKISISDICEGCGMNRKSFYYHFKDKYDLMNWIFYTDFITVVGAKAYDNGWELLESVCELFYNDSKFYRSAFKIEGQNSFKEYLLESMFPIFSFLFADEFEGDDSELIGSMFCEAYIMIVSRWINTGCKKTSKELIASVRKFIKNIAANMPD